MLTVNTGVSFVSVELDSVTESIVRDLGLRDMSIIDSLPIVLQELRKRNVKLYEQAWDMLKYMGYKECLNRYGVEGLRMIGHRI